MRAESRKFQTESVPRVCHGQKVSFLSDADRAELLDPPSFFCAFSATFVQESLANAQMELSSRPSLRNWRTSQRRIQGLEKKVAQASTQVSNLPPSLLSFAPPAPSVLCASLL